MTIQAAIAHLLANQHSKTGVVPLGDAPVLLTDDNADAELAQKAALHDRYADDLLIMPAADQALYQAVADMFGASDFKTLCLSNQEDFLVLKPAGDSMVLSGGGLFFPSKWGLGDKVGKHLFAVHAPAPHYDQTLGTTVDRMLLRLPEGRPLLRYNWTLHDDPALCQHPQLGLYSTAGVAPGQMIFRSERQVLVKIPGTAGVLFVIKTLQASLCEAVADVPALGRYLIDEISAMDAQTRTYKSLAGRADAICAYLAG